MEKIWSSFLDFGSGYLSELSEFLNCGIVYLAGITIAVWALILLMQYEEGLSLACFGVSIACIGGNIWWIAKEHEVMSVNNKNSILNISFAIIILLIIFIVMLLRKSITYKDSFYLVLVGICVFIMLASIGIFMETLYFI